MEIKTVFNPLTQKIEVMAETPDPSAANGKGYVATKVAETGSFIFVDGKAGKDGVDGRNGVDGKDGVNGKDGTNGRDGVNGKDGTNGRDGKGILLLDKVPTNDIGADGEWVFNKASEVFYKEKGAWKFYGQIGSGLSRGMVKSMIAEGLKGATGGGGALEAALAPEIEFNETCASNYSEVTYTNGLVSQIHVYDTSAKVTSLFTKEMTYTDGLLTQFVLTKVSTGATITKTFTYTNGQIATITIAHATAGPSALKITTNLQVELDCDVVASITETSGRCDGIADQTGNGNNFATTEAGTTYNPLWDSVNKVVRFDPTASGNNSGYAMLKSVRALAEVNNDAYTIMAVYNNKRYFESVIVADKTAGAGILSVGLDGKLGTLAFHAAQMSSNNVMKIHTVTNDAGAYKSRIGLMPPASTFVTNGGTLDSSASGLTGGTPLGVLELGGNWPASGYMSWYNLKALYIWSRVLTELEIQEHALWVAAKYSIDTALPTVNVVWHGDSLLFSFGATENLIPLSMSTAGYTNEGAKNFGVNGNKFSSMITQFPTYIAPEYKSTLAAKKNVYIMWGATNALIVNGMSMATVKANCQTLAGLAYTAGFGKVIIPMTLPRVVAGGENTNFLADMATFNSWLTAQAGTWFDAVVDFTGNTMMVSGAESDTSKYSDGIHPTDLGHSYLAPAVGAVIATVTA